MYQNAETNYKSAKILLLAAIQMQCTVVVKSIYDNQYIFSKYTPTSQMKPMKLWYENQGRIQEFALGGRECHAKHDTSAKRQPTQGGSGGTPPDLFLIGKTQTPAF